MRLRLGVSVGLSRAASLSKVVTASWVVVAFRPQLPISVFSRQGPLEGPSTQPAAADLLHHLIEPAPARRPRGTPPR